MTRKEAEHLLNELFDSWYPYLLRFARRMAPAAAAEDAVQEVFLALYSSLVKGQRIENPKAWTLCVLKREVARCAARDRRSGLGGEPIDDFVNELKAGAGGDNAALDHDELQRLFSLLTARELEVLLLRLEAMKYHEIASELGIATTSVGTLLSRAVAKLHQAVSGPGAPDSPPIFQVRNDGPETLQ